MKLEERKRVESIRRPRKIKTKGKHGEEVGDGTKTGAMLPTLLSSSPSKHGVLGTYN